MLQLKPFLGTSLPKYSVLKRILDDLFLLTLMKKMSNLHTIHNAQLADGLVTDLQTAIESGNVAAAADLAKRLATMRSQISATLEEGDTNSRAAEITVKVYICDKNSSVDENSITMKLPITMTIEHLKSKVFKKYGIPEDLQRWIIGKHVAHNHETLGECGMSFDGAAVFLYRLAPTDSSDDQVPPSGAVLSRPNSVRETANSASRNSATLPENIFPVTPLSLTVAPTTVGNLNPTSQAVPNWNLPVQQEMTSWSCHACTFVNKSTQRSCEMCGSVNQSHMTGLFPDNADVSVDSNHNDR